MGAIQRLAQKSAEIFWLPEFHEPAESSIGICCSSVDEKSGLIPAVLDVCIYTLTNRRPTSSLMKRAALLASKGWRQASSTSIPATTLTPSEIRPCVSPPAPQNKSTHATSAISFLSPRIRPLL